MGTFVPGTMGPINGKVGTLIASRWKETYVAKGLYAKSKKEPSISQKDHRSKFGVIVNFLRMFGNIIRVGYQNSTSGNNTPFNVATKYHMANAVAGTYPAYKIDYPKVQLTDGISGDATFPYLWTVAGAAGALVNLAWEANDFPSTTMQPTDMLTIVYFLTAENPPFVYSNIAARSALKATTKLPGVFAGTPIYGYAFFTSADGEKVSRTVYLGLIDLKK